MHPIRIRKCSSPKTTTKEKPNPGRKLKGFQKVAKRTSIENTNKANIHLVTLNPSSDLEVKRRVCSILRERDQTVLKKKVRKKNLKLGTIQRKMKMK